MTGATIFKWRGGEPMPLAFPKQKPSVLVKREARKQAQAEERRVRAAVKKRDGIWCRVCLALREPGDATTHYGYRASEMHHIVPRSLGGKNVRSNLIYVCRAHHQERHGGVIRISGDGDGEIQVERIWPIGGDA